MNGDACSAEPSRVFKKQSSNVLRESHQDLMLCVGSALQRGKATIRATQNARIPLQLRTPEDPKTPHSDTVSPPSSQRAAAWGFLQITFTALVRLAANVLIMRSNLIKCFQVVNKQSIPAMTPNGAADRQPRCSPVECAVPECREGKSSARQV